MFQNLREMWRQASAEAKLGLATGVVVILAIVLYFSFTLLRPEYQTLFTNLDPQDAAAMTAELDKMKVPYRVENDGATILVDKSQVHNQRLKLLGKSGTLKSAVGFEIFNNTDFGMTEFAQKINYQRALQGELTRTIQSLDEVKSARVHLVLPESGLFKKSGQKPKASITLAMKENRSLSPDQVVGIQRLVAASVPEIEPSAVTIADQRGVTLTRAANGEGEEVLSGRLGIKSEVEAYFARKLVTLFDKAFGPGRVIVSVDVTVNHDSVKVTREDVIPLGTRGGEAVGSMVRSRTTTVTGESGYVTAANTAEKSSAGGSATSEIEYQNGRRIEQVVSMPGSIKRLSVGIVLPNVNDRARVDEIRQLVATTVGANTARGDEIAITSLDLSSTLPRATELLKPEVDSTGKDEDTTANTPKRESISAMFTPNSWMWPAAFGALLLIILAMVVVQRGREPHRLTPEGREDVLMKVQTWLRQETTS